MIGRESFLGSQVSDLAASIEELRKVDETETSVYLKTLDEFSSKHNNQEKIDD
jgi:hypothetical protein